jgi:O-antigen/teichoic acid export membrane protein
MEVLRGPVLMNAASLFGSTVVTSLLGFVFWWIAARTLSPTNVGDASAVISTVQFLATFCVMGLSTLLISELASDKSKARSLIVTASAAAGTFTVPVAIGTALLMTAWSATLGHGVSGILRLSIFAALAALTTVSLIVDDACIGLLRGDLQLSRNTVFAASKLLLLPLAALAWKQSSGSALVAAWLAGTVLSLVSVGWRIRSVTKGDPFRLDARLLISKRRMIYGHHWLNVSIQAPRSLLPVLVTAIVSAQANASFFAAMLVVGFVNVIPGHLSTVLFALMPGDEEALRRETRMCMKVTVILSALSAPFFAIFSGLLLEVFNPSYRSATTAMILLGLTTLPSGIKSFYIAVSRVRNQMKRASVLATLGGALEIGGAAAAAARWGVTGAAAGLLVGMAIEAVLFFPVVLSALRAPGPKA